MIASRLDGITLEIIGQRIAEIVSTMEVLLFHSGYSTILRESNDGSATVLDRAGRVVIGAGAPGHIAAYPYTVAGVLARYPWKKMREGDAFVLNDPYAGGVHHVPDMAVVKPVFWEGRPLGFCATIAHKSDVGGLVPGSSSASAREIYHEGVLVPGVRYWTAKGPVEDAIAFVTRNSRTPELVAGDIRAQIGATRMGETRVHELVAQYGYEAIVEAMERLQEISRDRVGEALERWADGEGEGEAFLDSDGVDLERRVRFHARVVKSGRSLLVDFSGSDAQVAGPVNLRPQSAETASLIALLGYLDPTIPLNGGTQQAVTFVNPPGRITNAQFPAPCNNYMPSLHLLYTATQAALLTFKPARASAPDGFGVGAMTLGYRAKDGKRAVQYELIGPSLGASNAHDGAFQAHPTSHNTPSASIEILENEFPIRLRECAPMPDSGGAGRFRGGLACVREYELLEDAIFTLRVGGFQSGSWGIEGGEPGLRGRCVVDPGTQGERLLPALCTTELKKGTVLRVESGGGSGYGDPKTRDREALAADVRNGYVSEAAARKTYGASATLTRAGMLALLGAAPALLHPSAARAQTASLVRMGANPTDLYIQAFVAQDAGFFKRAGIDPAITKLPNGGANAQAVAANAIDTGVADMIQIANAVNRGVPFAFYAGSGLYSSKVPTNALCVAKSGAIKTAKDLEGKTIALVALKSITEAAVKEWLHKNGADPATVKLIEVPYTEMAPALGRGTFAAAYIGEPFLSAAKNDVTIIGYCYDAVAPVFYVSAWFALRDWIAKNTDVVRRLTRALYDEARWSNTHNDDTALILSKYALIDVDRIRAMHRTPFATSLDPKLMQPVLDIAARYGLIEKPVAATDLIAKLS